jgi:class I fructose-bisphosphate aldolase
MEGLERRTARIFASDGKSVVLAFDHGMGGARHAGMKNPGQTLRDCISAGSDAVLITPGLARQFGEDLTSVGVVINLDIASGNDESAVREAMLLGVEMGKFIFYPGSEAVPDSQARTRHMIVTAHDQGLPVMVEPIPVSFEASTPTRPRISAPAPRSPARLARTWSRCSSPVIRTASPRSWRPFIAQS